MRGRLLGLNVLLLALCALAGWRLRENWLSARTREERLLRLRLPALAAPQVLMPAAPSPVLAGPFLDVAGKLVMSRDRNPNVVLDAVPEKPVPPLPRFYGVMDFGEGPWIILADRSGGVQKKYQIGQTIGEFKLKGIDPQGMTFEWEGKTLKGLFSEITDRTPVQAPSAPDPGAAGGAAAAAAPASLTTIAPARAAPGVELTPTTKGCAPGDASPSGTVSEGYRKVMVATPFGNQCRWERVN